MSTTYRTHNDLPAWIIREVLEVSNANRIEDVPMADILDWVAMIEQTADEMEWARNDYVTEP